MTPHRPATLLALATSLALTGGLATAAPASTATAEIAAAPTVQAVEPAAAPQVDEADDDGWFTSWAQSQQRVSGKNFDNQSMRMVTRLTQGGDAVRIRLQNQYGTRPLIIDQTSLAVSAGGPAIVDGTSRVLTFDGAESVTIPVGGEVWSDPTSIETTAQQELATTFFLARPTVASLHDRAGRNNYGAAAGSGNRNGELSGASFTENLPWTYFVSAVDVYDTDLAGTIVAYGSSVVDGVGSENCGPGCDAFGQDKRWTDELARRVVDELPASGQLAVVNAGISGTTSAPACGGGGLDGVSRLDRDVLALSGVTGVIFYYGTNDLANGCSASAILSSYRLIFDQLHDAGIKVYVTPITPRPGYTNLMNEYRATVNDFVREGGDCSGTCDGVLDFDAVLRDPANPNSILPAYDTGDGVHANVAGQKAIADSISLDLLASAGAPVLTSGMPGGTVVGEPYSFTLTASGYPAPTFAVTRGTLPPGLSLDTTTGEISGSATTALAYRFTVTASNGVGDDASASYTIYVSPAWATPAITTQVEPRCLGGRPYLAVRVTNDEDVPLDVEVATAYGAKTFADVAAGSNAYQAFAARDGLAAGTVTVTASDGDDDGEASQTVAHQALTC
ncbi:GDSL-type esterase/lipase family protein [Cellulosimicrobium arenosum]|uniref:Ig domain-containing protein n=1 Tax=Cellulosimicrobium arenosum TaxID=2708133 RepID=A0A927IYV1_9MICO|nr:GDSL-type esterase/lipase family protein [Cellulosimicrobium arenosum]MBD8077753.1 putative Ig domain-containing protein [Cellulosimicrobium arenosum]